MLRKQRRQVPHPPSTSLDKEQFRRRLREYVEAQQITNLSNDVISDLFRMTRDAADNYSAKKALGSRAIRADLRWQDRLLKTLRSHIDASLKVLANYEKRHFEQTGRLTEQLRPKFSELRQLLGRADVKYKLRAQALVEPILRGLNFPGDLSLEINHYLEIHAPEIQSQECRTIVIAGCLDAGDFYSKPDDLVSVIPMQLSRAKRRVAAPERKRSSARTVINKDMHGNKGQDEA
jgi:hypothetical protein